MPSRLWMIAALAFVLFFTIVGCQTAESPNAGADAASDQAVAVSPVNEAGNAAGETAAVAEGETDATPEGVNTDEPEAQLMVRSGTATLPAQTPIVEQERPQPPTGIQKTVTLADAIAAVDFEVLQPNDLPESADLSIVQLVEPPEGQTSPELPAVRMIYDVDGQGVIVLLQSPATGAEADGEPKTIAGTSGWVQQTDELIILTWESGPVRYEMRGSGIDMDALERAAGSLVAAGA